MQRVHTSSATTAQGPALVRHAKRSEWGLGTLVWEREGKRGYRFEDGRLRVFKAGFEALLVSASAARVLGRSVAAAAPASRSLSSLREQLDLFLREYPAGFDDDRWIEEHRGRPGDRELKCHREPLLVLAAERLDAQALDELVGRDDEASAQAVRDRVVAVLQATDLVPRRHVEGLADLPPTRGLAISIVDLIHGEGSSEPRIGAFKSELARLEGPAGSWPLMSALRGLVHPHDHTCIRPSVFAAQAKLLMPAFNPPKSPSGAAYAEYLYVARLVEAELCRQSQRPRDLLDVYDFIWGTLRPAVRANLERSPAEAA